MDTLFEQLPQAESRLKSKTFHAHHIANHFEHWNCPKIFFWDKVQGGLKEVVAKSANMPWWVSFLNSCQRHKLCQNSIQFIFCDYQIDNNKTIGFSTENDQKVHSKNRPLKLVGYPLWRADTRSSDSSWEDNHFKPWKCPKSPLQVVRFLNKVISSLTS